MGRKKMSEVVAMAMRKRIIDAAESLFKTIGYSKTTVSDIAGQLNMSQSNVYRYFPTKADITREIGERLVGRIEDRCMAAIDPASPVPAQVKSFVLAYHLAIKETLFQGNTLYDMVAIVIEQQWPLIHAHGERILARLTGLIAQGVAVGEFREVDAYRVARAMHHALVVFIYPQLLEHLANEYDHADPEDSLEQQLLFLVDTFFSGIRSRTTSHDAAADSGR